MTKARDLANGGFGLVLIKPSPVVNGTDNGKGTVSFSAQSSVSLNDVFSSTYENYKVVIALSSSTGTYARVRLRVSGSDASGSNYDWGFAMTTNLGSAFQLAASSASAWNVTRPSSGNESMSTFEITNPFLTKQTILSGTTSYNDGATVGIAGSIGGRHTLTTSYTGVSVVADSGTITGTVSIYGFNK